MEGREEWVTVNYAANASGILDKCIQYNVHKGKFKSKQVTGMGRTRYLVDLQEIMNYQPKQYTNSASGGLVEGFLSVDRSFKFIKLVKSGRTLEEIIELLGIHPNYHKKAESYFKRVLPLKDEKRY